MSDQGIGARVKRVEDKRFITGNGRYTDDHKVAGMHYAAFVRSPHAYAKIKKINISLETNSAEPNKSSAGSMRCRYLASATDHEPVRTLRTSTGNIRC